MFTGPNPFVRGPDRIFAAVALLTFSIALAHPRSAAASGPTDPLDASNVLWSTPSTNSSGSMPLGNGDVGINLWVEVNGDLLFYLSKTDAWDEHARLLKLGRIRVKLSPNPFRNGLPFRQELRLRQGEIQIQAGETNSTVTLAIWVDANDPVVRLEARGDQPFEMQACLELWRTTERALVAGEESGTDSFGPDMAPVVYPDAVLAGQQNRVVWFHRNERSIWPITLQHQGLASLRPQLHDPLLGRTFGGLMKGAGLVSAGSTKLKSPNPGRRFNLDVAALTAQTGSLAAWVSELEQVTAIAAQLSSIEARQAHRAWWNAFWNRSWIRVTTSSRTPSTDEPLPTQPSPTSAAQVVSQGYALQRFLNACGGRGQFPIKFNGSIFTVDVPGQYDPDYRQWGGCYWFQNTRLAYWPMLASGDFDLLQPLFRMYRDMLPLAKARTEIYFQHGGAFFPETMHFWGAYHNGDLGYGWNRQGEPFGRTVNQYIRFYYSSGLELSAIMLDYYALTQDDAFLKNTLLPLTEGVLQFYNQHYPHLPHGPLLIVPGQSLETWWHSDNPLPEIAGLHFVLDQLLVLPPDLLTAFQKADFEKLRRLLPPVPKQLVNDQTFIAPAESFSNRQNMENPELYAIFPYRLFGVGKPELELARRTFTNRMFKGNRGWQQDDVQMAFLGLTREAREFVSDRFATKHSDSRFPAFWGPNFDWIPDQDHGNNGVMTLQTMLLQFNGRKMLVFPAWPKHWDVEFKLHAPCQTTVQGVYRNGELREFKVTPRAREKDVIRFQPQ